MDISREEIIVSAMSSLLAEKLSETEDFSTTESFGVKKCHDLLCQAFACALQATDEAIFAERDPHFSSKGFEARCLLTSAGHIVFKRRRYRTASESICLLDEILDLPERRKVSPLLGHMAATFALDASYRAAAKALEYYIGSSLSPSSVARLLKQDAALLSEVETVAHNPKISVPVLDVEADGICVALQRSSAQKRVDEKTGKKRRRASKEVGVFVAYSGKENTGANRQRENLLCYASSAPASGAWQAFVSLVKERYETKDIFWTNLACDGDLQYLAGKRVLPGKVSTGYDLHHIPTKIAQTLGADIAREVFATMKRFSFEEGYALLTDYCQFFFEKEGDEKYRKLMDFFKRHKGSMAKAFIYNLGCAESTNAHIIGARMKRFGGGWASGLEPMARLRAASACNIRPALAHRQRQIPLPEQTRRRTLSEIEEYIARLEQKAKRAKAHTSKKQDLKPEYYNQVHIAHRSKNEHCASLLHKWA
jgi:hypothetical protein